MRHLITAAALCCTVGWAASAAHGDATVDLTSNVTTVAEGGSINFTVTVTPSTYVEKVILTYEGEQGQDEDTSPPYTFQHQFDTPGDDITVTATVQYTNDDPDGQDTLDVDVVGLMITGNSSPMRGWPVGYLAQSNPTGKAIDQFNWTYAWSGGSNTHQDNDTNGDDKSIWSGKMIVDGTLSCSATVSGVAVQKSMTITVRARYWSVPISCAQDNEVDWGDVPEVTAFLGANRDRDSDVCSHIFVPRNAGDDFSPARTISEVPAGPCEGWWYVVSSMLKCQRETVINRYIKSDGPLPSGASVNFYNRNDSVCFAPWYSASDFVQAVENHEYRGTPDTYQSIEGHQGRMELSIKGDGYDPAVSIESLARRDRYDLEDAIDAAILDDENEVIDFALDEDYMQTCGPNWGGMSPLGAGQNSRWNTGTTSWSNCDNGPDSF